MPRDGRDAEAIGRLVKLGLLEVHREGKEIFYATSENGCRDYATALVGIHAVEIDRRIMSPYDTPYDISAFTKGIEKARATAAEVQRIYQRGKLIVKSKEMETAITAACATVNKIAGKMEPDKIAELGCQYFCMLVHDITPENVEYWLTGERTETIGG